MKRTIIALLGITVIAASLSLAVPAAGAATGNGGPGSVSATNLKGVSLKDYNELFGQGAPKTVAAAAEKSLKAAHPGADVTPQTTSSGAQAHFSVQWGWFDALVIFTHSDLKDALFTGFVAGAVAEAGYLCGVLPGWITTAACIFIVAIGAVGLNNIIGQALNQTINEAAFWCPPNPFIFCASNAIWISNLGWLVPVQNSGLNIAFSYLGGVPIGWQINPYSG